MITIAICQGPALPWLFLRPGLWTLENDQRGSILVLEPNRSILQSVNCVWTMLPRLAAARTESSHQIPTNDSRPFRTATTVARQLIIKFNVDNVRFPSARICSCARRAQAVLSANCNGKSLTIDSNQVCSS
ncbi:hypothetical protein E2P81_ATG04655 [Venturia nashicola]|uniref:Uncharacterized protein n=1 Tax=Venturia nashicola TaxID=86259 RepID=A0A4Z1NYK7_9PEZI|nr:hypothetical protein E6O75_ATG04763 [Venturia nashicola]TLD34490.1 hypothetical protein E2P81_ATG04655 [Venturia nashicola]